MLIKNVLKIKKHKKIIHNNYISVASIKKIIIISILSNYFNTIMNIKFIISNIKSEIDYLKTEN